MSKIICYGVYGKICSGKTTLLKKIKEIRPSVNLIIADDVVNELYLFGHPGYNAIKTQLGHDFVTDIWVDKSNLRKFVLTSNDNLITLNKIIFPILKEKIARIKKQHFLSNLLIELALLNKHYDYFKFLIDKLVLIQASEEIRKNLFNSRCAKSVNAKLKGHFFSIFGMIDDLHPHFVYEYEVNNLAALAKKIIKELDL